MKGGIVGSAASRTIMALTYSTICKGCWKQMHMPVPLRGPMSIPFRAFGIRPSGMNPNLCTICEMAFSRLMKARTVMLDATILFADLRAYTRLSQSMTPSAMAIVLDQFYDQSAEAIWQHDGLLNKTIGDAVMAVFNFPIRHQDHARRAVDAAKQMQKAFESSRDEFGVGIGIHTGEISFGEFGRSHRDLTAIGTVVNTASRVQSAAQAGEILVTQAVRDAIGIDLDDRAGAEYSLKGFDAPVTLYPV
jgi:class 3 adenylate cyclase